MFSLATLGGQIAEQRKKLKLSQRELAQRSGLSRATVDALENGRAGELGYTKIVRLLAALGLELSIRAAGSRRPTLDELLQEDRDAQGLDRRR